MRAVASAEFAASSRVHDARVWLVVVTPLLDDVSAPSSAEYSCPTKLLRRLVGREASGDAR